MGGDTTYEAESQRLDYKVKNKGSLQPGKRKRDTVSFDFSGEESEAIIESPIQEPKKKERGRKPEKTGKIKDKKLASMNSISLAKSPLSSSKPPLQRKISNPLQNISNTKLNITKKDSEIKGKVRKLLKMNDDSDDEKKKPEPIVVTEKIEVEKRYQSNSPPNCKPKHKYKYQTQPR